MRRRCAQQFLYMALLVVIVSSAARAEIIIVSSSFNTTNGGIASASVGLQPFNPALGTLDRVSVRIDGIVSASGSATGGVLQVTQSFTGLRSRFFTFDSPATVFTHSLPVTMELTPYMFSTVFSYDFSFDAGSELFGFTIPSFSGIEVPPVSISGSRSTFTNDGIPIFEALMLLQSTGGDTPILSTGGAIITTYEYTPHSSEAVVPLPGVLSGGLVTLAWCGARRRSRIDAMRR